MPESLLETTRESDYGELGVIQCGLPQLHAGELPAEAAVPGS
jgi:hypothetical protein